MRKSLLCLFCVLVFSIQTLADQLFPKPSWKNEPDRFASPDAYEGGEMAIDGSQFPDSLNYYLDTTVTSSRLFNALYERLLSADSETLAFGPNLASQWRISDDQLTYTFTIDKRARWSDGKPITAHDVAWTYDAILNPANLTGPHKISLERFDKPEVIDDNTIRFKAKETHWKNLIALASFHILPKHAYADKDFNKINFEFPVVSGPYRLTNLKEGIQVSLERRDDWWQRDFPSARGIANLQTLVFKFFADRENAFEAFKAGNIDFYPIYSSAQWAEGATGRNYDNNWIIKQKVYNYEPIGFQGFAINMRRELFKDKRVRLALAHLLNRKKLNNTLMYNVYFLHQCYYEDLYDDNHGCEGPVIGFDRDRAAQLLAQAGWVANKKTGWLEKDGKPFVINMLTRAASSDKYLVDYRENLKDVGIQFNIVRKDWAAWVKDMDEYNYDMTWAAWGPSVYRDPESMWYSKEADRPSGQNVTGFKNARVDELIEQQRTEFDINKRNAIIREIDGIVSNEIPYILLWNINYTRLLYWNKFGTPDTVLGKYNDEAGAFSYWWYDEDAAADLEFAMEQDKALPRHDTEVHFDQAHQP